MEQQEMDAMQTKLDQGRTLSDSDVEKLHEDADETIDETIFQAWLSARGK